MHEIISICKGGGYLYCKTSPIHPKANSNGLYPLHRVLVENNLNRYLLSSESVHHIDENKNNNDILNLMVLTKSEHAKIHCQNIETLEVVCPCCGGTFKVKPHLFRLRKSRNKSGNVFCSRTCGGSV